MTYLLIYIFKNLILRLHMEYRMIDSSVSNYLYSTKSIHLKLLSNTFVTVPNKNPILSLEQVKYPVYDF